MAWKGIGGGKAVIVADDGVGLAGIVADSKQVYATNRFPASATAETVLNFGRKQGAKQVLFLSVSEVRELDVKLGAGLDPEERRSAIEYAADSHSGEKETSERLSYLTEIASEFRSGVLVSAFDVEEVMGNAKLAAAHKLKFLGMADLKLLLMLEHFSDSARRAEAFLLLFEPLGFAAIPDRNRLTVRNLPFGLPEQEGEGEEYVQKLRRRLSTLKNRAVRLCSPGGSSELVATLSETLETKDMEVEPWENTLGAAAVFYLGQGRKQMVAALPPPKPKDPKASGTVIGLTLFGAAVVMMCFIGVRNHLTLFRLERRLEMNLAIEKKVKEEEAKLKKIQDELASAQELNRMLLQKQRVSKDFLVVLNLLCRYKLEYTKIISIEEQNRGIALSGETVWQPDLSRFFSHFEKELTSRGLALFSDGIIDRKDNRIEFRSHVAPVKR